MTPVCELINVTRASSEYTGTGLDVSEIGPKLNSEHEFGHDYCNERKKPPHHTAWLGLRIIMINNLKWVDRPQRHLSLHSWILNARCNCQQRKQLSPFLAHLRYNANECLCQSIKPFLKLFEGPSDVDPSIFCLEVFEIVGVAVLFCE